jgi:hypothetical protein
MSAGDDQLAPLTLLDRARGKSFVDILTNAWGATVLGFVTAFIIGIQDVLSWLFFPFTAFIEIAQASIDGLFVGPLLRLPSAGITETIEGLQGTGLLGFPFSVGVLLLVFGIIAVFLAFGWTSNFLPGVIMDNPIVSLLFNTPEEEAEGDDT